MKLVGRYKKLSFWNKLGVWGSIASVSGIALFFLSAKTVDDPRAVVISYQQHGGITANTVNINSERSLTLAQKKSLIGELKQVEPAQTHLRIYLTAEDGQSYAAQIADALTGAGWTVSPETLSLFTDFDGIRGLAVLVRDVKSPSGPALSLYHALSKAGLAVQIAEDSELPAETFYLWVGRK